MSKINAIYNAVYRGLAVQQQNLTDGVVGTKDFDKGSMRKQFIHEVVNHETLSMSKAGAASYYQMCRNRASGTDMYSSHRKWNQSHAEKVKAEKATTNPEEKSSAPVDKVEPKVDVDTSNRWIVGNTDKKLVFASFTSRAKAQTHNKVLTEQGIDSKWIDSTKVNTDEFTPAIAV